MVVVENVAEAAQLGSVITVVTLITFQVHNMNDFCTFTPVSGPLLLLTSTSQVFVPLQSLGTVAGL